MSETSIVVVENNPVITTVNNAVNVAITENTVEVVDAPFKKYGAFEFNGRQQIADTTAVYAMPLDTTDFSGDVYISNTSRINFPTAGLYNIQWSGQFQNTSNSIENIYVWLRINGVDVPGSTGFISINARKSATEVAHNIIGWNYFLRFTPNQYAELVWSATNTTVSLESYSALTNPIRPSTAAIILTAQQVA